MNVICITGNLTRDPELRTTQSGMSVCSITVAANYYSKAAGGKATDFFSVELYGKTAENVAQFCSKGTHVEVSGAIHSRNYTDKGGINRTVWEVNGERVDFLGRREDKGDAPKQALSDSAADEDLPF